MTKPALTGQLTLQHTKNAISDSLNEKKVSKISDFSFFSIHLQKAHIPY
jgi:hypothetical protein